MALKSTIYKAELAISDMDRHYYAEHHLTIAKHPSETDERVMMRLLAFALLASERLQFAKGLSDVEEPDLWEKNYADEIIMWCEIGQPDERRILKGAGRSEKVVVLSYNHASDIWWQNLDARIKRTNNVQIWHCPSHQSQSLVPFANRTMQCQCTIQDGQIWFSSGGETVEITLEKWKA